MTDRPPDAERTENVPILAERCRERRFCFGSRQGSYVVLDGCKRGMDPGRKCSGVLVLATGPRGHEQMLARAGAEGHDYVPNRRRLTHLLDAHRATPVRLG